MSTLQSDNIDKPVDAPKREPRIFRIGAHTQPVVTDDTPRTPARKPHELMGLCLSPTLHSTECKIVWKSLANILMMEAYQALKMHVFGRKRGEDTFIGGVVQPHTADERNESDEHDRQFDSMDGHNVSEYMSEAAGHEVPMRQIELAERLLTTRNWCFQNLMEYEDVLGEPVKAGPDGVIMYRAPIHKHLLEKENAYTEFQPQSFEAHMEWAHQQAGKVNEVRLARTLAEMAVPDDDIVERRMIREMQAESAVRLQAKLHEIEFELMDEAGSLSTGCEDLFGTLPRVIQERVIARLIGAVQKTRMRFIRSAEMSPPDSKAEIISDIALTRGLETTLRRFAADCGLSDTPPTARTMAERNKLSPRQLAEQLQAQRANAKAVSAKVGDARM